MTGLLKPLVSYRLEKPLPTVEEETGSLVETVLPLEPCPLVNSVLQPAVYRQKQLRQLLKRIEPLQVRVL